MTVHFAEACGVFLHTGVFYLKLRADFAGFWEEPDVFSSYSDTAYTVQKEDKLADLSKYFTEEELSQYVDSYIQDGYFNQDGALYLFPVAKSAEITMINKTDWEPFAEATGTTVDELTTTEGITEVAGNGERKADDFFYQPYAAAQEYADTNINMVNLGNGEYTGIAVTSQNNSLSQALEQTKAALTAARRGKNQFVSFAELNEEEKRDSSEAAFNEVASLERLKEMTLSSVALNLFDREGKTSVVLDILSLKLQEKYRLSNMIITHFSREYMVNDLFYCWQRNHFQGWDGLVHCKEKEYQQFMEEQEMQLLLLPEKDTRWAPLIQPYLSGENDIVFHMTDNGRYSGSIIFQGISSDIQGRKEECKCLGEISAIIQNRLNVERQNAAGRRKV